MFGWFTVEFLYAHTNVFPSLAVQMGRLSAKSQATLNWHARQSRGTIYEAEVTITLYTILTTLNLEP